MTPPPAVVPPTFGPHSSPWAAAALHRRRRRRDRRSETGPLRQPATESRATICSTSGTERTTQALRPDQRLRVPSSGAGYDTSRLVPVAHQAARRRRSSGRGSTGGRSSAASAPARSLELRRVHVHRLGGLCGGREQGNDAARGALRATGRAMIRPGRGRHPPRAQGPRQALPSRAGTKPQRRASLALESRPRARPECSGRWKRRARHDGRT